MRLGIIADDLTGACDAVAPFAARRFRTVVEWPRSSEGEFPADVLSICTGSRADIPLVAAEKAGRAGLALVRLGVRRLYQKMDSTLKGNFGSELLAIMQACGFSSVLVAPAFPHMGRRIIDGRLELALPEECGETSLLASLERNCGEVPVLVSLKEVRKGPVHLAGRIQASRDTRRLFVADAEDTHDLDTLAATIELLVNTTLPVGSGGLAASISRRMAAANEPQKFGRNEPPPPLDRPVDRIPQRSIAIFVGTTNERSRQQLNAVKGHHAIHEFEVGSIAVPQLREELRSRHHFVVRFQPHGVRPGLLEAIVGECAASGLGALVLIGGDTALAVCEQSAARAIEITGELQPGVPIGRLSGGRFDGVTVVTKAGGFGDPTSLLDVVKQLAASRYAERSPA